MSQKLPRNRHQDGGIAFEAVDSFTHPSLLAANKVSWLINGAIDGGVINTRPGYDTVHTIATGRAQGIVLFTPTDGIENLVFAVSGKIYISPYPFDSFTQLPNISFDAYVDQVVFKEAVVANSLSAPPKKVLIMQDGRHRAAYWDGSINRHLDPGPAKQETPIGLWMEWIGGRLWVSRGNQLFASDILNPLSFTETQYLATGGSFQAVDGTTITGLRKTADAKALLVGTLNNMTVILAGITDRAQWQNTPNFVSLLFPGVGITSGKSWVSSGGDLWWFSMQGAREFTQVGSAIFTSRNSISSIEMQRSFVNLSPFLDRVCGFAFDKFLGFSVPSGDQYNRHTWILDKSSQDMLGSGQPAGWNGIWMGTRPVEWTSGFVQGVQRVFYISQDADAVRVWEAFKPEQTDNGGRIFVSIETAGMKFEQPFGFKAFQYSEMHLSGLAGEVEMTAEYKGDYGCWKEIMDVKLCAKDENCDIQCENMNFPSPQNRYLKTQQAETACETNEGPWNDRVGTYFQNRFRWYGKNGVRAFRANADEFQEDVLGKCEKGDASCKVVACCDPEVNYISHHPTPVYGS